jgi:hypothetical protein
MRTLIWALLVLQPLVAQTSGSCGHPFETATRAGRDIAMNLRSGDITISGTDSPVVRVSCSSSRDDSGDVSIRFIAGHLTIRGGSHEDVRISIEVPRSTNLIVRGAAGNLTISGISGDKDVELNAGNLTIEIGTPNEYRRAEASILAGDLRAPAFGVSKDGLFRSFNQENSTGRYRLRAHLMAGNLTFK